MKQASSTPPSTRRHLLIASALPLLIGTLPACGFALRQAPNLPFNTMFAGFAENSNFGQELRRSLESTGVRVITDNRQLDAAQVMLDVLQDQREKVVVGVNSTGLVREFQLRIRFKFRLRDKAGNDIIPETQLLQQRDFSFSESSALAKEAEETLIYRSMQSDLVQQVLRRLSAVKSIAQ